jgi:hypothetical protein
MGNGWVFGWVLAIAAGLGAIYGLHRLALWLEDRGHLYYLRKKPGGGALGSFVALQKIIEPGTQHVEQVRDQEHLRDEEGEAGQGSPPRINLSPGPVRDRQGPELEGR